MSLQSIPLCRLAAGLSGFVFAAACFSAGAGTCFAQFVANTQLRPFVVGVIPVAGRGAVGGVAIDAKGVVSLADRDTLGRLRKIRQAALQKVQGDVGRTSRLRKVSLRRLEAAINDLRKRKQPISDAMLNLAGVQRIRYVLVYPEQKDIVLAGFAEGWQIDQQGSVVGRTTGQPTLQIDDLVVALRNAARPMSCSIDPTEEGISRLRRITQSRGLQMGPRTIARMEAALGPQQITVTGIDATTHFACVMVAADVRMKRLAMGFEKSPVSGLTSYLELIADRGYQPRNMMPRWWLAPSFEPLLADAEGLAWEIRGNGVKAMTEETFFDAAGRAVSSGRSDELALQWADALTDKYPKLCEQIPIFAQLRNGMDLAVVAALIAKEDLLAAADYDMPLLLDEEQLPVASYRAPKSVSTQASFLRADRNWVVSLSGGVEIDVADMISDVQQDAQLANVRRDAQPPDSPRWWWD